MAVSTPLNLQIHHGGRFMKRVIQTYDGGFVELRKNVDHDSMSFLEIQRIAEELSQTQSAFIYYLVPGQTLDGGLKPIQNDIDVVAMLELHHSLEVHTIIIYINVHSLVSDFVMPHNVNVPLNSRENPLKEPVNEELNQPMDDGVKEELNEHVDMEDDVGRDGHIDNISRCDDAVYHNVDEHLSDNETDDNFGVVATNYLDEAQEYAKIWDYAEMVKTCDAGSHVVIKCDASMEGRAPIFNRIYIRFNAQKVGFLGGCRPFVGLDALFLKGPFGGHMLTAVGRDGNDNIFPIAIAIVESECSDSWHWFLQIFKEDIGNGGGLSLVFISNKQKGVDDALIDLFPTCEHRYCMKHLYENFSKKFAGQELIDALWQIANATTRRERESKMNAMKNLSEKAWQWLLNISPPQWCKSHFGTRGKCDALVNNMNKSFKNMVNKARALPIISLLEWYRICLMKRFNLKREGIMNCAGDICPNILRRLEKTSTMARDYLAIAAGANMYEVGNGFKRHVVNLNTKTCTCRLWELQGLPCRHGIAAILHNGQMPTEFVHDCFKRDAFRAAYQAIIPPMPGKEQWPKTGITLMPPNFRKQPVRLKESRKRGPDEPRKLNTASRRKG